MSTFDIAYAGRDGATQHVALEPRAVLVVGRDPSSDVVLPDATVSRRHVVLRHTGDDVWIEDLGSTGGTRVDGTPLEGRRRLLGGETIEVAGATLRLLGGAAADETQVRPAPAATQYTIERQAAGTINNVGRDQHLSYVQHVQQQRDSFGREIAATRTKARVLVWLGVVVTVAGFAGFLLVWSRAAVSITEMWRRPEAFGEVFENIFGPTVLGIPAAAWAIGASGAGELMIVVGVVLHVVATARRRRLDRDLPVPPPWQPTPSRS